MLLLHKGNGGKRADFKGTHSVKATVKQTSEFRATQMWGYLWQPSKWLPYFRAKRKDPNLALPKLSRFKVGDLVLGGVLMDPAEGWTSGIYNLDRMVSEGVELAIDAGDTADGLTEADVQAIACWACSAPSSRALEALGAAMRRLLQALVPDEYAWGSARMGIEVSWPDGPK